MDTHGMDSNSSNLGEGFSFRNRPAHPSVDMGGSNGIHKEMSDTHDNRHALHEDSLDKMMNLEDDDDIFVPPRNRRQRPQVSINQNKNATLDPREIRLRINYLENLLASANAPTLADQGIGADGIQHDVEGTDDLISDAIANSVDHDSSAYSKVTPEIIERPWPEFMNKQANEESDFAIEVLKGDPTYYQATKVSERQNKSETNAAKEAAVADVVKKTLQSPALHVEQHSGMPDRIRINSPYILTALSGIDKHIDASGPVVMLRPFKFLIYHTSRISEAEGLLRRRSEEQLDTDESSTIGTTLSHLQCLLTFINIYITPTVERLRNNTTTKIAFRDLWLIFNPGEDIFMPLRRLRGTVFRHAMDATPETFLRRYNMLWRVIGAGCGRPNLQAPQSHETNLKPTPFKINCYYVDFDGKFFIPTIHEFAILPFVGERDILDLDFYPVRFLKDGEQKLFEHTEQGKKTFAAIAAGFTHFYYSGLTMVSQPCGCFLEGDDLHQEYVDSEVVVDFKATLLRHPGWRPRVTPWKPPPRHEGEVHERCPVRYWKDKARQNLENSQHDYVYDDYHIDRERAIIFRNQEPLFSPIPSGWASNAEMVPQKDVGLLAGRAFAFVLRTRSFAPLWLWALEPIEKQSTSLDNLQLRQDSFKDTIYALVESHFRQVSQKSANFEYDIVKGKGKGLVMLLHGAPGVGKTSTAESVAAKSGRPLFQITSGDLGLSPGEVEKNLKEIFRFAQLWGCILLLDECDIFLAQRDKNDIKRNGLVSVFLRTLEFFTGVLFLTTNRVGVLDHAVRSRLTWTAHYPALDESQTMRIWKVNLKLLRQRNSNLDIDVKGILRFALKHFRSTCPTESSWNGRQIQTAFKVATALAEWDLHSQTEQLQTDIGSLDDVQQSKPVLRASHFEIIAKGTQDFEDYMQATTGLNERERAFNALERMDDFEALVRIDTPTQDDYGPPPALSPVNSHRRMSNGYPQSQTYDRAPASPHTLQPTNRRKSVLKWQPQISPSASANNLVSGPNQYRSRRMSSSRATGVPTPDVRLQSSQVGTRQNKGSYNGTPRSAEAPLSREISRDEEFEMHDTRNGDAFGMGPDDSASSLDGYGEDI